MGARREQGLNNMMIHLGWDGTTDVRALVARTEDGKEVDRWMPGTPISEIRRDIRDALSFLGRPVRVRLWSEPAYPHNSLDGLEVRVTIYGEWHTLDDGVWID